MSLPKDYSTTRFEIDPRRYPKSKPYVVSLSLWVLLMLAFFIGCVRYKVWVGAVFAGMLPAIVVPIVLRQRKRVDTLQVTPQGLLMVGNNRTNSAIRVGRDGLLELTLEHIESQAEPSTEAVATLNLWDTDAGFRRRHILGLWLAEDAKAKVMEQLSEFLIRHGFQVTTHNAISSRHTHKVQHVRGEAD